MASSCAIYAATLCCLIINSAFSCASDSANATAAFCASTAFCWAIATARFTFSSRIIVSWAIAFCSAITASSAT